MEVDEPISEITSLRNNMLDHISLNKEAHFKSQQLNEPDLTASEKRQIAETLLERNPGCFLSRFGKYLKQDHLEYFAQQASENYEVNFYINDLKQHFKVINNKALVRNRRLEALRRLTLDGEYFSDDEMRKRDPLMYEHLVGQYLTEEEKHCIQADRIESKSFTGIILSAVDEREVEDRLKSERENEGGNDEDSSDNDSEDSFDDVQTCGWGEIPSENANKSKPNRSKSTRKYPRPPDHLTDEEKSLLMNEFRSHMYSEFLLGKDKEFDYSEVDTNNDYDDLEMLEIDQQDKYFDSETPEILLKGEGSSDSSHLESQATPRSLVQKMADLGN